MDSVKVEHKLAIPLPESRPFLGGYLSLVFVAGLVLFLDQWTKNWVRENLSLGETFVPFVWMEPYARIIHWRNSGAAFGFFQESGGIFTILAIVVAFLIIYYFPRIERGDWPLRLALGFQLGGALGNLVDRLQHGGHVTDFISVGEFPVFNIADSSITLGVVILLASVWLGGGHEDEPDGGGDRLPITERVHTLRAPLDEKQRLDKFLVSELHDYSRTRLQGLIKAGHLNVNGHVVLKSSELLEGGELVELRIPAVQDIGLVPEQIPLNIVFENEDVIVVNKPAGLVVHPAAGHATGTLINAVLAHAPEIEGVGGELRPGLVHRLDKDTSGLILLAKNERAQRDLQKQFQGRTVEKTYYALVDGHPPSNTGRIDAPIGRDPRERKRMAVVSAAKGRSAISEYRVLEHLGEHSFMEVTPRTGRTHQIRVHLAYIGSPVTGDLVYGKRKRTLPIDRHFLHAAKLSLQLPGEDKLRSFHAPLPTDLREALDSVRAQAKQSA